MTSFRFIDLFAGIGGFRAGFDAVGGTCVFTSEIDKHARLVYAENYGIEESEISGDITKIDAGDVPQHDLLIGGFPCQAFSRAGKELGFDDARGTLFFDICRILEHHKTPMFVLENVIGLTSHNDGETYKTIVGLLRKLGYVLSVRIINAIHWLPQNRNRIFITGTLKPEPFDLDFMIMPNNRMTIGDILEPHYDPKTELSEKIWDYMKRRRRLEKESGDKSIFGYYKVCSRGDTGGTLTARYGQGSSCQSTLIRNPYGRPRRLSVREASRYMGFDDPQGSVFKLNVGRQHAYRLLGNAVCPPVSRAIAEHLFNMEH